MAVMLALHNVAMIMRPRCMSIHSGTGERLASSVRFAQLLRPGDLPLEACPVSSRRALLIEQHPTLLPGELCVPTLSFEKPY